MRQTSRTHEQRVRLDYCRTTWRCHRRLRAARSLLRIVDEVDSILVDEARTPLIISAPPRTREVVPGVRALVRRLQRDKHTRWTRRSARRDHREGISVVEDRLGIDTCTSPRTTPLISYLNNAIKPRAVQGRQGLCRHGRQRADRDDHRRSSTAAATTRASPALEARRGLQDQEDTRPRDDHAQNLLKRDDVRQTGSRPEATTSSGVNTPRHPIETRPMIAWTRRPDLPHRRTLKLTRRRERHRAPRERPAVLIGTASVAKSEKLSKLLVRAGILTRSSRQAARA